MVMVNHGKGNSYFGKIRPFRRGRYFDKVRLLFLYLLIFMFNPCHQMMFDPILFFSQPFVNMNVQRRPKWFIPPEEVRNFSYYTRLIFSFVLLHLSTFLFTPLSLR